MAFGADAASSSSSNQQYVSCGTDHLFEVDKIVTPDNRPEVSDEQKDTSASIDFRVEEEEEEEDERPPYIIVVHGPPEVGESEFIKSLADYYSIERLDLHRAHQEGSFTIISGKRRIQFVVCPNNVNGMRNAAKYADAVILLIDAYVGFEMETFKFVNILRIHGMPKVIGVMTSLFRFENNISKKIRTLDRLIKHFRIEICEGARVFCLSGLEYHMCMEEEIHDLASFILDIDFMPLSWQVAQPYVLTDHFEDVTPRERVHMGNRCNRDIVLHGYLRGSDIKKGAKVHIADVGDFPLFSVTSLADPCPLLAGRQKKRSRKGKELDESEGFRSGTYLRLEVRDVPLKMFECIGLFPPILVVGICPGEENVGYMQAKHTTAIDLLVKEEEPPYVIVVCGPPKVGKSLLIRSLVEQFTRENPNNVLNMKGPVTIRTDCLGEHRRIQFVECGKTYFSMLNAAMYADAVIFLIDTSIGFQMGTFVFLTILRDHGMPKPKVMGVLISRGVCTNAEKLLRTKKRIMKQFCAEISEGLTLFSLSGLEDEKYPKHEILDLASFISVMEFHSLAWRAAQPYVLVDRYEDVTPLERVHTDNRCNRDLVLYGYLRGCDIKNGIKVHISGVRGFPLFGVTSCSDPCPTFKSKGLKAKEQDEYSGFRPGTYLRLEVRDVPFDVIEGDDLFHPLLVGGISPGKEYDDYNTQCNNMKQGMLEISKEHQPNKRRKISKRQRMLEKILKAHQPDKRRKISKGHQPNKGRKITKKHQPNKRRNMTKKQPKLSVPWSPVSRVMQCARNLYGNEIPTYYTFVRPPHHIKSKK